MPGTNTLTGLITAAIVLAWTAGCGGSTKARTDAGDDAGDDAADVSMDGQPDAPDDGTGPDGVDALDDTIVPDVDDADDAPDAPAPVCGDGATETSEKCDDSNLTNGDGCNPTCDLWGTVITRAGSAGSTGSGNGTGTTARFNTPTGLATDGTNIYLADAGNCVIRQIEIATWDVTTLAGTPGNCGFADGNAARFNVPQDVVVTGGYVYVADTDNHVIRRIGLSSPVSTSTVAGTDGSSGTADGTGSAALFNEPRGIATDGTYLYVADFGNHTIRRIEIGTWVVTTIAGQAGTPGSTDATGTAAQFNYPRGLEAAGSILYVADTDNHTIRRIVLSSGAVTTIAGQAGSSAYTDAAGGAARFSSPRGIAVDAQSLYVADFANHAIRQIIIGSWDVTTLCGTGSMGTADGTGTSASLHGPWGITFDPALGEPSQVLYVAETGNSIVRTVE
ncbi:MAG: hypothetical protein JRG91_07355 [Deltaproteobacteria bacterium]|nr:hypothetical protein [Deltaproteobacteria bacterium]